MITAAALAGTGNSDIAEIHVTNEQRKEAEELHRRIKRSSKGLGYKHKPQDIVMSAYADIK